MATANLTRYTVLDIISDAGDTLDATNATFTDDDGTDYTGYDSASLILRSGPDDSSAAVVTFSTTGTAVTGKITLLNGSFYLESDPEHTDGKDGLYYYAMKIKTGVDETLIMKGTWLINPRRVN